MRIGKDISKLGFDKVAMRLMSLAALLLVTSCSMINEEPTTPETPQTETIANFYLTLDINANVAPETRSATTEEGKSEEDTQNGYGDENIVQYANIYFFEKTDNYSGKLICKFFAGSIDIDKIKGEEGSNYSIYAKMEPSEVAALMGKELNVYVVANHDMGNKTFANENDFLSSSFNTENGSQTYFKRFTSGSGTSVKHGQLCPMSNYEFYSINLKGITIPDGADDKAIVEAVKSIFSKSYDRNGNKGILWDMANTQINNTTAPGKLALQRMIARLDFKDGSQNGNYLYQLAHAANVKAGNYSDNKVYLKITGLQIFNASRESYVFRHTILKNNDGTETDGPLTPLGFERGHEESKYNWIADVDWDSKESNNSTGEILQGGLGDFFISQPKSKNDIWTISNGYYDATDYFTTWKTNYSSVLEQNSNYIPWFYLPENTLPSTEKMTLPFSTGIAFKVVVCNSAGTPIQSQGDSPLRITMTDESYQEIPWNATENAYVLTYRYLIEHNNKNSNSSGGSSSVDGNTGTSKDLDPMQIGVVRNNIYRVSVTGINYLPDPKKPDLHLEMNLRVLPWGVRSDEDIILK